MLTAYNFRLYPDRQQKEMLSRYFGCGRIVWNKALELRENYYKEHRNDSEKKGLNCYQACGEANGDHESGSSVHKDGAVHILGRITNLSWRLKI